MESVPDIRVAVNGFDQGLRVNKGNVSTLTLVPDVIFTMMESASYTSPRATAFVSDSPAKIRAAKETGCVLIGISSDRSERDQFVLAGADAVFNSLSEFCVKGIKRPDSE